MKPVITLFSLLLVSIMSVAGCSNHNPYGDPDSQRDRSKDAQDEMSRSRGSSGY